MGTTIELKMPLHQTDDGRLVRLYRPVRVRDQPQFDLFLKPDDITFLLIMTYTAFDDDQLEWRDVE